MRWLTVVVFFTFAFILAGCDASPWNNPNSGEEDGLKVLYSNFAERPKHLDPARSYSSDESRFIAQIYEPPLQYHYLKRPYQLTTLTLTEMPALHYEDAQGNVLSNNAGKPTYSVYTLTLQPGIRYQPHPAFAVDEAQQPWYRTERLAALPAVRSLADFTEVGTRELRADDYIYQMKRLADPARLAPLRGLLSEYIVGMNELTEQISEARRELPEHAWLDLRDFEFTGVEKVNDLQFRIRLHGTYPQFTYWLAFHFFAPIPWEVDAFYHLPGLAERNINLNWHPVGTGPFMMTENNPNAQIVLERNPHFRGEPYPSEGEAGDAEAGLLSDAGRTMPFIDKAVYRLEKEAIPIWTKFLQGYYDRSAIASDSFDQAISMTGEGIDLSDDMRALGITLDRAVMPVTYYMGFNMLDPVVGGYDDRARKLRHAIAIAYNEEEYINIFMNGRGETAMGPIPPGIFGYQSGANGINRSVFDWQDNRPIRKPLAIAKQLLAEAGYPDGRDKVTGQPLVLNLDTTGAGSNNARINWIISQFRQLGIQLNIRSTDYNRFKEKMENGNAQIFYWGWMADYPDPENFLFLLVGDNAQVDSKSGVNASNYKNAEYDALFEQMRLMENGPERMAIIRDMLALLQHDMPWGSSFHAHSYVLNNSWVSNSKPHGIANNILKYLNIDHEQRQREQQWRNQPVLWPIVVVILGLLILALPGYFAFQRRQQRRVGE